MNIPITSTITLLKCGHPLPTHWHGAFPAVERLAGVARLFDDPLTNAIIHEAWQVLQGHVDFLAVEYADGKDSGDSYVIALIEALAKKAR